MKSVKLAKFSHLEVFRVLYTT